MKRFLRKIGDIFNNRCLILCIFTILIGIVYIFQLFNLQIINGAYYRQKAEKRMLRTKDIAATRGEIYDTNGVVLATSKLSCDVYLYKVRVSTYEQNLSILKLIKILEANGDKIYSTFPINETMDGFSFEDKEEEKMWKKENNLDSDITFDETIETYIKKYELENISEKIEDKIKVIRIKYEANINGYSLFRSALIARDISEKSIAQIEEKGYELYGVDISKVSKRYYPNDMMLSHVLGYVSKIDNEEYKKNKGNGYTINSVIGKSGIEKSFEKYLKGQDGEIKVETDTMGNVTNESVLKESVAGNSITLTIDYRLQKVAEESLESCIKGLQDGTLIGKQIPDSNAGAVVVLDVKTGEVLAMASYPSYNINSFVNGITSKEWSALLKDSVKPMVNRAISGKYSPGSTFKMLVGIAGLEAGGITVDEKIQDTGIYKFGHNPKCWIYSSYGITHGYVNLEEAIKGSCNCYFYEVGRRIGIENIIKYGKLFGLDSKTGIELEGEAVGNIAGDGASEWYLGQTLSAAIGQADSSFTPIAMANYISAIANGGTLNKVSIIKGIGNENINTNVPLDEIDKYSTDNITGVNFVKRNLGINNNYINSVKEGMLSVTNDAGGTSYFLFKNSNIKVAGKTGTSQVSLGSNNGIFVGFAPYDDPQIAVVAIIEHGGEGTYTARVVKPIMEEYFNITTKDKQNDRENNIVENGVRF